MGQFFVRLYRVTVDFIKFQFQFQLGFTLLLIIPN